MSSLVHRRFSKCTRPNRVALSICQKAITCAFSSTHRPTRHFPSRRFSLKLYQQRHRSLTYSVLWHYIAQQKTKHGKSSKKCLTTVQKKADQHRTCFKCMRTQRRPCNKKIPLICFHYTPTNVQRKLRTCAARRQAALVCPAQTVVYPRIPPLSRPLRRRHLAIH